jgi:GntR family transcriptional regulator
VSSQVDISVRSRLAAYRGPVPIYLQVAHLLGQRLGVEWRVGERLPSEQALADELGVNRHTLRRAVALLLADGLVSQHRGRGMIVLRGSAREVPKLVGNVEEFFVTGAGTTYRVTGFARQPLPSAIAQRLDLPEGSLGYRVDRIMLFRGEVVAYLEAFVPEDVGRALRRFRLERDTLVSILTRRLDRRVVSAEQTIEAALADPPIARVLEVAPGAPLLRLRFTFREAGGRPINCVTYHYRADRYVYTARLAAARDAGSAPVDRGHAAGPRKWTDRDARRRRQR